MDLGIAGRTALVMGASAGLGRGVAAALAREGARVAIASRSRDRVEQAAREIEGEVAPFVADTDDLDRVAALPSEVAGDGITVNTVATGRFATERVAELSGSLEAAEERAREEVPAGRLGTPEEYGDLVAFLCSERAAYLTGATIPLDGGVLRST